ncbi:MAG TPA: response regulator [Opitutaceae bacterium]
MIRLHGGHEQLEDAGAATILIVSENPAHRQVIGRILCQAGYRVIEATGGEDARRAVSAEDKPELLLIGPDILSRTGLDLLLWLRAEHHSMRLLATAGSLSKLNWINRHLDDVAVLVNPFTNAQLTRAISRLLEREPAAGEPNLLSERFEARDPLLREENFGHLQHRFSATSPRAIPSRS